MGKHNIEKYSLFYSVIKSIAKFWHDKVYYRKVISVGLDNFNRDAYNIIVINHQNALMDPLSMIFSLKGQPVVLARASAFKNRIIARLLYSFKMLPVYRPRDGWDTVKQNDEIFVKTIDVIKNKNGLAILPEGNHAGFRRLRKLQKGVCRIAFQTEEDSDFGLDIQIAPVGVEYTHYYKFREIVTVVYGKPFGFKELHALYKEKPNIALNELKDKIYTRLKETMLHIDNEEDYEALDELRNIVNGKYAADPDNPKVCRDKELIKKLEIAEKRDPSVYREICNKSLKIKNISKSLRIGYYHLEKKSYKLLLHLLAYLGLIILTPVALYGFLTNFIFYNVPNFWLRRIKDKQFLSTYRFVISLVMAILFVPLYAIISFYYFNDWRIALVVLLSILPSGWISWNYFVGWRRLREGARVRRFINRKNPEFRILKNLYNDLLSDLKNV